ncbi:hypothetical protein L596_015446 [Steinernema carpocapsae]|uniref:Uncharacterized protein n=1 Tax=Steinernema carpocapsae TaxID=34508 RepID=A0A4U5NGA4_STECR|nr:hypothetical protein L596_015446 [Steinernema carpocapsae]
MPTSRTKIPSALRKMSVDEIAALEEYCSTERVALLQRAVGRMQLHVKDQDLQLDAVERLLKPKPGLYGVAETRHTYSEAIMKLKIAVNDLQELLKNPVLFDTDTNRHVIGHLDRTMRNMTRLLQDLVSVVGEGIVSCRRMK